MYTNPTTPSLLMATIEKEMEKKKNQLPTPKLQHETAGEELISICMRATDEL